MMGKATYLFGLVPKNPQMQHKREKNMRLIQTEGHSTNYLTDTPQNGQGHQKQGWPENLL